MEGAEEGAVEVVERTARARALGGGSRRGFPAASAEEAAEAVDDLEFIEASVRKELLERAVHDACLGHVPGTDVLAPAGVAASTQQLQEAMRRLRGQTYVRLERLQAGDHGAERVAEALAAGGGEGDRLKALYLGENGIGDEGAAALTNALLSRLPCKLTRLYMQDNPKISRAAANSLKHVCDTRGIALVGLETDPPPPPIPVSKPAPRPRTPVQFVRSASPESAPAASPAPPVLLLPCNRQRRAATASVGSLPRGRAAGAAAPAKALTPIHAPRFRQTRPLQPQDRSASPPVRYDLMPCARTQLPVRRDAAAAAAPNAAAAAAPNRGGWTQSLRGGIHLALGTREMLFSRNVGKGSRLSYEERLDRLLD